MTPIQLACIYLILRRRRKNNKSKIKRRWWVRPILNNRKNQGAFYNLHIEMRLQDTESFFNFYRMTPDIFDKLLHLIGPGISKQWAIREPISASERLSLTLRYLASGDSMKSIMYLYRIGASTISNILAEVCEEMWRKLAPFVLPLPKDVDWKKKADDFNRVWNFPNCCAALDGKHIVLQAPPNSGSLYYNYKGTFSIILLAMCDANYVFTAVDIGAPGRQSDGGVFSSSEMGKALESCTFGLPVDAYLANTSQKVPHVVVGDEAFPLKLYLMRPYPGKYLNNEKTIFNYRLSRARRTIENSFGILASRMRILRKPIIASIPTANSIVKAVVVLHNYLQSTDIAKLPSARTYCPIGYVDFEDADGILHPGLWRQEANELPGAGQLGANCYSYAAGHLRQTFTNYFMTSGSVPWQWNKLPDLN